MLELSGKALTAATVTRIDDIKGDRSTENKERNFWWIERNIFEEPNGNFYLQPP